MKKLYVSLLSFGLFALSANAQITLSGNNYSQSFTNLSSGLPTGWSVDTNASATHLGGAGKFYATTPGATYYDTTFSGAGECGADVVGHGFNNSASADQGLSGATQTCAQQAADTNRALGVRQTSTWGDAGASYQLELANTTGFGSFVLKFKLQGLDITSGRSTPWTVDYGIGAVPTVFTPVTPLSPAAAYMVTGSNHFTDTTVVVNFGSALDNQSQPVWIRISALSKASGGGNRTTSAIDDYVLAYGPTSIQTLTADKIGFKVLGGSTSNSVNFACNVQTEGNYTINMYDITGRMICTQEVNLAPGAQQNVSISNKNLVPGMYIARITDGITTGIAKVIVQ